MGDLSISVNGQTLQHVQVRQVKDGQSLQDVQKTLEAKKDGYDTIGLNIEGVDYLIYGNGLQAKAGDKVTIEGQAAGKVAFVEQEEDTFEEGFRNGVKTKMGGLEHSVAGAPLLTSVAAFRGGLAALNRATATEKVIKEVTQGPPITKQLIEDAAKAISHLFGGGDDE